MPPSLHNFEFVWERYAHWKSGCLDKESQNQILGGYDCLFIYFILVITPQYSSSSWVMERGFHQGFDLTRYVTLS